MPLLEPSLALTSLAGKYGIPGALSMSAKQLLDETREQWLRSSTHQFQIPGGPPSEEDLTLLRSLGLVNPVETPPTQFIGVLIGGATVVAVRKRLAFFLDQILRGSKIHYGYLLGGARPLDAVKENTQVLLKPAELPFNPGWSAPIESEMPTTEAGMMRLVLDQSSQTLPRAPWSVIDTPLQSKDGGGTRPPNFVETYREFLKTDPPRGHYLVVTSQPYVERYAHDLASVGAEGFSFTGVGYAAPPTTPLNAYLDEIPRLLQYLVK